MTRPVATLLVALLVATGCRGAKPQVEGVPPEVLADLEGRFDFVGNESFDAKELWQAIAQDPSMFAGGIDRAAVDDAAYQVEEHYLRHGYPFAQVDFEIIEPEGEPGRALLTVVEDRFYALGSFDFVGVSPESREVVSPIVPEPGTPFVLADVEDALTRLEGAYDRAGFLRAQVGEPEIEYEEGSGTVGVRVQVEEGPRFVLRSVRFDGEPVLPAEELAATYETFVGLPFHRGVRFTIRARIVDAHRRTGWPDCAALLEPHFDEETGDVELFVKLDPGEQVTVGEIRVEGAEENTEEFVLGRLRFGPGDLYDSDLVRESQGALYRTGLFQSARIVLAEDEGPVRDVTVDLTEYATRDFFVEPGYGSYEGPRLGFGMNERSVWGSGRSLRFEGLVSAKVLSFQTIFTDPYFLDERYILTVTQFNDVNERPAYTIKETGGNVSVRRNWTEEISTSIGYEISFADLDDVDLEDPEDDDADSSSNVATLFGTIVRDTRDQIFAPTAGTRAGFELDFAANVIGSSDDFLRPQAFGSAYHSLTESTVVAAGLRLGAIFPLFDTDTIPLQERFFNGGENTVRAFEEDELGPKDSRDNPRGGEAFSTINVELRQVLSGNLHGALFYDAGSVAFEHQDLFDFDDFGHGPGVGIRYLLPVGSIRLDWAWNLSPDNDEDDTELHLSVGMAF